MAISASASTIFSKHSQKKVLPGAPLKKLIIKLLMNTSFLGFPKIPHNNLGGVPKAQSQARSVIRCTNHILIPTLDILLIR